MTTTITIAWNIENAAEEEIEIGEQTEINISETVEAFADVDLSDIADDALEDFIVGCVDADFREKVGPVVQNDAMTEAIAALRKALEEARST